MPPFTFSEDDYTNLLQKLNTLETKIQRLEVNVEINDGYDTTLPLAKDSGHEAAIRQQTSTSKDNQKDVVVNNNMSNVWNVLGAKPKSNSSQRKKREPALPGDICDATSWPALPARPNSSSTPIVSRTPTWTAVSGKP